MGGGRLERESFRDRSINGKKWGFGLEEEVEGVVSVSVSSGRSGLGGGGEIFVREEAGQGKQGSKVPRTLLGMLP